MCRKTTITVLAARGVLGKTPSVFLYVKYNNSYYCIDSRVNKESLYCQHVDLKNINRNASMWSGIVLKQSIFGRHVVCKNVHYFASMGDRTAAATFLINSCSLPENDEVRRVPFSASKHVNIKHTLGSNLSCIEGGGGCCEPPEGYTLVSTKPNRAEAC